MLLSNSTFPYLRAAGRIGRHHCFERLRSRCNLKQRGMSNVQIWLVWSVENYLNSGAHLASLLQLGHLKSQGLEGVMEGLVNGHFGKKSRSILLEWQQRLVVVTIDVAN